jgi:hypothetical protein
MTVATEPASPQTKSTATGRMKALVYHGPGKRAWEETPRPVIQNTTDAIVRITTSTICVSQNENLRTSCSPQNVTASPETTEPQLLLRHRSHDADQEPQRGVGVGKG